MVTSMRSKAEWKEFAELLLDKEVRMNGDVEIVIESSNSHFETLFKPQQVVVLEWLRRRTCIPNLMITVAVKASTQEKTPMEPVRVVLSVNIMSPPADIQYPPEAAYSPKLMYAKLHMITGNHFKGIKWCKPAYIHRGTCNLVTRK